MQIGKKNSPRSAYTRCGFSLNEEGEKRWRLRCQRQLPPFHPHIYSDLFPSSPCLLSLTLFFVGCLFCVPVRADCFPAAHQSCPPAERAAGRFASWAVPQLNASSHASRQLPALPAAVCPSEPGCAEDDRVGLDVTVFRSVQTAPQYPRGLSVDNVFRLGFSRLYTFSRCFVFA